MSINVLHVYSSTTAGGAEKLMLALALELEKSGIKNHVATPKDSYAFARAKEIGLPAYHMFAKGSFDPFGISQLWNAVSKASIDIIHAHQGKMFWPSVIIKKFHPRHPKLVFHRHAHIPHSFYSRSHYNSADKVIAIASVVAKDLLEKEGVPREKVSVVYNGTDLNRFSLNVSGSNVRQKHGLANKTVIGTAGAMNRPKGKGQQYLIEAVKILKDRFPDIVCLIVGDGQIRKELEDYAKSLGVSEIVIFAGYQEKVEEYIAAMDIFCFLSWDTEGFGQVMVEAQSMGKPVIGTNVGGIPETFINGKTGILIPKEDTPALVKAISSLLENRERMKLMGKDGAKFVSENFSIQKMAMNISQIYKELMK